MLKLGTQNISGLYVGEQKIKRALVGTDVVFEDNPTYTVYFYAIEGSDTSKILNSSSFAVNPGESVTVYPWNIDGYYFEGWYEGDMLVSTEQTFVYTPTKTLTTIYLRYSVGYAVWGVLDSSGPESAIIHINNIPHTITKTQNFLTYAAPGTSVKLEYKNSEDGYTFSQWYVTWSGASGSPTTTSNPYTFIMPSKLVPCILYLKKQRLPAGYTEVEYVKSTATVCIDTGITPNISSTKIESKWMLDQYNSNSNNPFFGGSISSGKYFVGSNSATVLSYRFQSATGGIKTKTVSNMVGREITINVNYSSKILTVDGSNVSMGTVNAPSGGLYLFSFGTYTNAEYKFIGKCYFFKIYSGSTLVADFVPCKNPSGVVGMYDTVRKAFYTVPSGRTALTAGPAV